MGTVNSVKYFHNKKFHVATDGFSMSNTTTGGFAVMDISLRASVPMRSGSFSSVQRHFVMGDQNGYTPIAEQKKQTIIVEFFDDERTQFNMILAMGGILQFNNAGEQRSCFDEGNAVVCGSMTIDLMRSMTSIITSESDLNLPIMPERMSGVMIKTDMAPSCVKDQLDFVNVADAMSATSVLSYPDQFVLSPIGTIKIDFHVFAAPIFKHVVIAGGPISISGPGDNVPLTRVPGTIDEWRGTFNSSIYSALDPRLFYTILASNLPEGDTVTWNWGLKEDISGQACAQPDNYNDRQLELQDNVTMYDVKITYGSCSPVPPSPPSPPPAPPANPSPPVSDTLIGSWKTTFMGVGPAIGNNDYFSYNAATSSNRECWENDIFTFGAENSFHIDLQNSTWVEKWQGNTAESCATPVAPYISNTSHTFEFDASANTLTVKGVGAYIALPKAINGAEISNNAAAPQSVTYNIVSLTSTNLALSIETNSGVFWNFLLQKA